jgi:hypothetical protein
MLDMRFGSTSLMSVDGLTYGRIKAFLRDISSIPGETDFLD